MASAWAIGIFLQLALLQSVFCNPLVGGRSAVPAENEMELQMARNYVVDYALQHPSQSNYPGCTQYIYFYNWNAEQQVVAGTLYYLTWTETYSYQCGQGYTPASTSSTCQATVWIKLDGTVQFATNGVSRCEAN